MKNSIKVTFPGSTGASLSARLETPPQPPIAFAIFAHCFTCGKDLPAERCVAAELTRLGIATLRFDFTGLGSSGGEFHETDFSGNVADLVAAAQWLEREHRSPQLLIGHSMGGAAVLAAAPKIASVEAVATIGAPASLEHVTELFDPAGLARVETMGTAEVTIAGRSFYVGKDLIESLRSTSVLEYAAAIEAALLLVHSPIDNIVSIEHARALWEAARHPKSFLALDGSDHLISDTANARYAAVMIGTWARRYITDQSGFHGAPKSKSEVVVAETGQGRFLNQIAVGEHRMLADEPEDAGGLGAGPDPYDYLCAALGSCTSMTVRLVADRRGIKLERVVVEVDHQKVHSSDLESSVAGATPTAAPVVEGAVSAAAPQRTRTPTGSLDSRRIDVFRRTVRLFGDLSSKDHERLLAAANQCPVHRTLSATSRIETVALDETSPVEDADDRFATEGGAEPVADR